MTTRPPDRRALDAEEEARFLARYDASEFERLSLAVDVVLISAFDGHLFTLLARRKEHPHKNRWALPGGFVRPKESLEDAAARLLETKGGLAGVFLEQLYTFGAPNRDPRTRVVSIAYYALVEQKRFVGISDRDPNVSTPQVRVPWEERPAAPSRRSTPPGVPCPSRSTTPICWASSSSGSAASSTTRRSASSSSERRSPCSSCSACTRRSSGIA